MTAADGSVDTGLTVFLQAVFACSEETARGIRMRAQPRRFEAEAAMVRQGDHVREAFLMWLGRARATHTTEDGRAVTLRDFAPGEFFGALGGAAETAEAEVAALEESRLAVFLALDFMSLAERYGCVGLALSRVLMRQLKSATDQMVARTTLTAFGRVYQRLLELAGSGERIEPAPVLAHLAEEVHTTRETASRAVHALERRGIVRREGRALVIVSRRRLEGEIA
jgi:CRP/FNR family transcriptional regulator, cyclic AMP receptor protein